MCLCALGSFFFLVLCVCGCKIYNLRTSSPRYQAYFISLNDTHSKSSRRISQPYFSLKQLYFLRSENYIGYMQMFNQLQYIFIFTPSNSNSLFTERERRIAQKLCARHQYTRNPLKRIDEGGSTIVTILSNSAMLLPHYRSMPRSYLLFNV